jgi:hypothetical protein
MVNGKKRKLSQETSQETEDDHRPPAVPVTQRDIDYQSLYSRKPKIDRKVYVDPGNRGNLNLQTNSQFFQIPQSSQIAQNVQRLPFPDAVNSLSSLALPVNNMQNRQRNSRSLALIERTRHQQARQQQLALLPPRRIHHELPVRIQHELPVRIPDQSRIITAFKEATKRVSQTRPYSFFTQAENIRLRLKSYCNVTVVAKLNDFLENHLVDVRSRDISGHHGLSAASGPQEAQHAGYRLGQPKPPKCEICKTDTNPNQLQLEHGINFFAAAAFVGLGNESNQFHSPMVNDLYCYACPRCNRLKSDVLFIEPPSKNNMFKWTVNNNLVNIFREARNISDINPFKTKLTNMVNKLNGNGSFLDHKYPDIDSVKLYLTRHGLTKPFNDNILRRIAHYISGLEMIGYYRCFNKFLVEKCDRNTLKGPGGIQNLPDKLRQFEGLLTSNDYRRLTANINTFINQFIRDLNSDVIGVQGFGKKVKKVKVKTLSLTTLKHDLKFILNNF